MTNKKFATFQQWTTLHETFGGAIPLGVTQSHTIGLVNDANMDSLDESLEGLDLESLTRLEEACKKAKKKKMLADLGKKPELEIKPELEEPEDEEDDDDEHEEDESPEEEEEEHEEDDDEEDKGGKPLPSFLKKKEKPEPEIMMSKKKAKKQSKKHMTAEDTNWWNSLKGQASLKNDDEGNWDGFTPIPDGEPAPGEPGFAPQTRVGWFQ